MYTEIILLFNMLFFWIKKFQIQKKQKMKTKSVNVYGNKTVLWCWISITFAFTVWNVQCYLTIWHHSTQQRSHTTINVHCVLVLFQTKWQIICGCDCVKAVIYSQWLLTVLLNKQEIATVITV